MTSSFREKSRRVKINDENVIVDNSVEIGDFSIFTLFFAKKYIIDF